MARAVMPVLYSQKANAQVILFSYTIVHELQERLTLRPVEREEFRKDRSSPKSPRVDTRQTRNKF